MKKITELTLNEFTVFVNIYGKYEYEYELDREIDLVSLFFNLTKEEVEELPIKEYNEKVTLVANIEQDEPAPYYVFTHEGVEYKAPVDSEGKYVLRVKDKRLIELYLKANPEKYISYVAAIIFSNSDYSEEGINARAELFGNAMQMQYLSYHFNQLK